MKAIETSLDRADRLVADGCHVEAIDVLMQANREHRSKVVEEHLVQLRHDRFLHYQPHTDIAA